MSNINLSDETESVVIVADCVAALLARVGPPPTNVRPFTPPTFRHASIMTLASRYAETEREDERSQIVEELRQHQRALIASGGDGYSNGAWLIANITGFIEGTIGRLEEAMCAYETAGTAAATALERGMALSNGAVVQQMRGETRAALQRLLEAVAADPESASLWADLVTQLIRLGEDDSVRTIVASLPEPAIGANTFWALQLASFERDAAELGAEELARWLAAHLLARRRPPKGTGQ